MALSMNLGAEDKKKLYLLGGLLGVLGVLGTIFVLMPMLRGSSTDETVASSTVTNTSNTANTALASASPATTPPANGASFGTASTVSAPSSSRGSASGSSSGSTAGLPTNQILAPQLIGVGRSRQDPFSPEVVPPAPPTPEPKPRVDIRITMETLPPQSIPPYLPTYQTTTVSLPSGTGSSVATSVNGTGGSDSRILAFLPPAAIFGNTARVAPRPIPVIGGLDVAAPGAQANLVSDDDKRVAGVIIGDSIRALIEYRENGQTVSRVVQPGDSVGGMEILSISRVSEGGEQLVRVTVRENGQEKYFDLKSR